MKKKDIIKKLTSRKMWLTLTNFISMLMIFCGSSESTATQVAALIMAGASVIAYVIAEGWTDASADTESEAKND